MTRNVAKLLCRPDAATGVSVACISREKTVEELESEPADAAVGVSRPYGFSRYARAPDFAPRPPIFSADAGVGVASERKSRSKK